MTESVWQEWEGNNEILEATCTLEFGVVDRKAIPLRKCPEKMAGKKIYATARQHTVLYGPRMVDMNGIICTKSGTSLHNIV